MQAVQAAHVLAVGAGFAAETGGVGGHLDGEILLVEDHVAEDVRHRHLGRRDEVEIVHRGVVHLSLLVGSCPVPNPDASLTITGGSTSW